MRATPRFGVLLVGGLLLALPAVAFPQDRAHQQSQQAQPAPQPPPPPPSPPPAAISRPSPPVSIPHSAPPPPRVTIPDRAVTREGAVPRTIVRDPAFASPASADQQQRARSRDSSRAQPAGVRAVPRDTARVVTGSPSNNGDRVDTRGGRTRDGRPSYGTAVSRPYPRGHGGGGGYYYPGSSLWWDSYPYSFGFFAWDPFWWGATYPAYPAYPAYPSYPGYPTYAPSAGFFYGGVRLKVKPSEAEVYVDGYFAGQVDDYDGAFQKLKLATGAHHIQIQSPGYDPLDFDVNIQVDQTITYRGELQHQ